MTTALLLVAHGSRIPASNEEVRTSTSRLRRQAGGRFTAVDRAFLEFATPDIPEGIERLVRGGAEEIVVLPYFLAAGRHVGEDIPAAVQAKREEHPDIDIRIAPYLGTAGGIAGVLLALADQAF